MDKLKVNFSLKKNINIMKEVFCKNDTIIFRDIWDKSTTQRYCIIYSDGMVDIKTINENIIKPLALSSINRYLLKEDVTDYIGFSIIQTSKVEKTRLIDQVSEAINRGQTILFIEDSDEALILETREINEREISEPSSENVLRGSREGFTESIITNTTLLKKMINNNNLRFEFLTIGSRTKTKVCITYIEDLAPEKIVEEVKHRVKNISIDGVLESSYIEEIIRDNQLSIFPTIGNTEKPDNVASKLLEGRVAIICDNNSFVLTLPYLFIEHFQVSEDYYNSYAISSLNRILRIIGFWLSISVPALYVGVVNFHQEILPTSLYISIAQARAGVPIPTVFEAVLMLFTFEILREAGARIPKQIGQAVSIVGALVLGESAVNARLVSAPMVIVVALTGISGFLNPSLITTTIILRIILLALTSSLRLFGYTFGLIGISMYLVSIKSFGVNYMEYSSYLDINNQNDLILRKPWPYMNRRPSLLSKDIIRAKFKNKRKV